MNWHEYFTYDDAAGALIWKERPIEHFASSGSMKIWNAKFANKVAGGPSKTKAGIPRYAYVLVAGTHRVIHRIIWEMHYGPIPDKMVIDHKDRYKANNRVSNLRLATESQNAHNSKGKAGSVSGIKGAHHHKRSNKYVSTITNAGRKTYLGIYDTPEEAHKAYVSAATKTFGEFMRSE